jgi:3-oxoacyl-[acyl-carrier-protein] synthase III
MSESTSAIEVCIAGTGSYVPERILTNEELAAMVDTSDEWIVTRTGIKERRIAAEDEFTSHMASKAALNALEQAGMKAEEIELIVVATITPDTPTPATACHVQHQLGAMKAVAFDISAACSGFLYAMKICKRLISDGAFNNALIIGAEKLSSVTNWEDRSTCVLFGDGAGAAVLRRAEPGEGSIVATEMGTDGNLTHLLEIPGGGTACPITAQNVGQHLHTLNMQGREVFKIAVTRMKEAAEKVIERAGWHPRTSPASFRTRRTCASSMPSPTASRCPTSGCS